MDELADLLHTVANGRPLSRRQLRLAIRRRGLVRLWAPAGVDEEGNPVHEEVVSDWNVLVTRGVGRAELTPRGRQVLAQ